MKDQITHVRLISRTVFTEVRLTRRPQSARGGAAAAGSEKYARRIFEHVLVEASVTVHSGARGSQLRRLKAHLRRAVPDSSGPAPVRFCSGQCTSESISRDSCATRVSNASQTTGLNGAGLLDALFF